MKPVIIIAIIVISASAVGVGVLGYNQYTTDIEDLENQLRKEKYDAEVAAMRASQEKKDSERELFDLNIQKLAEQKKASEKLKQEQDDAADRLRQEQLEAEQEQDRLREQIRQEKLEADRQLEEQIEADTKQQIILLARTNPVLQGMIDGTLYFYIEPIPSYYKVPGIYQAVENIASSLERDFYSTEIRRTYNENSADIVITWVKDFGSSTLGHAIFKKYVEVRLGEDNCWGDWQPYTTDSIKKVMWHEIGHSLGYDHSSNSNNVMYYTTSTQLYQDVSTTFDLESRTSQWFSFCTSGAISFHAESSKDTDGFDAYAIPPDDPRGFSNNGGSTYVTSDGSNCGTKNIISITRYCNVGSGAYLHFKNTESHLIYITFEMYDRNQLDWPNMTWDQKAFEYDPSFLYEVWNLFH